MTLLSESPGTIALPTSEVGRFAMFTVALAATQQPPESAIQVAAGASVTENLNQIFRQLRPDDRWVWILGDDHVWPADTLMTMLRTLDEHPEIDALVPLVVRRNPPWRLGIFHELMVRNDDGELERALDPDGHPMLSTLAANEIPVEDGVWEIESAGSAGMLLRREVVDAIGDPWFYSTMDNQGRQVVLNEDVTFCSRMRSEEYGFRLFATTEATLGHLGIFNVRAIRKDGRWGALVEFAAADDQLRALYMPAETAHALPG